MRNLTLLGTRLVVGGYLAVHGAQKLFGAFDGPGLEATASGFDSMGLKPGKAMATLAGASELGGGVLTATGIAHPVGPLAIAGTMGVAAAVHRKAGPMGAKGGFELPLTNLALAAGLVAAGPGKLKLGPKAPTKVALLAGLGGAALAGWSVTRLLQYQPPVATDDGTDADVTQS